MKETKMNAQSTLSEALASEWQAFKQANDERLKAIETGRADVLLEEKVDRIDRALHETRASIDRLSLSMRRPPLSNDAPMSEQKSAWSAYLRRGDETALARLEQKALSVGVAADGGYVAPPELDRLIEARLRSSSPMRAIATVRTTNATVFKKPISLSNAGTGWVAETGERTQTTSPQLAMIEFPTAELYANLAATQVLLDDAFVNVDEWIAGEVDTAFSAQERSAFISGNGTNKPKGLLSYTLIAEASHTWDKIGYIATGAAGAFPTTGAVDKLLDLAYAPRAEFRQNARFVLNRKTLSAIRKLKDADNRYIWQPESQQAGATILGYPVTEIEEMPDIGADAFAIAFGDFARGYMIVDRAGVRVLRDPYSAKPYVLFYVTKRVGGGVQNFDAIKLMKFAAS
jgi:HK97 family phage major capsid protein